MPAADFETRFWSRTIPEPNTGCFLWTGAVNASGYGVVVQDGKPRGAHRAAWEISEGKPIPDGLMICHKCHQPACVNPAHLNIGTAYDNACDRDHRARGGSSIFADEEVAQFHPLRRLELRRRLTRAQVASRAGLKVSDLEMRFGVSGGRLSVRAAAALCRAFPDLDRVELMFWSDAMRLSEKESAAARARALAEKRAARDGRLRAIRKSLEARRG